MGPSFVLAFVLNPNWLERIHKHDMQEVRSVSKTKQTVSRSIPLHLTIGKSLTHVTFSVLERLVVPAFTGTSFADRYTKSFPPTQGKVILCRHSPVPLQIVHDAGSVAEKEEGLDIGYLNTEILHYL